MPITSSEPQFAATKAMPVMANGSDRPAQKKLLRSVIAAAQAESDQQNDKKIGNDDAVIQRVQVEL